MRRLFYAIPFVITLSCAAPEPLRLNDLQIIASHNSYKDAIERPLMNVLLKEDSSSIGLDYKHLPLTSQLDIGIRGFEIDVLHDPEGGRFSDPKGIQLLDSLGAPYIPYDREGELDQPGFKVLHVPDIDFRSHCLTFTGCLSEVKLWSQDNPGHLPVIITINPKNSGVNRPGFTKVVPFTDTVWTRFDQEILSVFYEEELITPDLVRGSFDSLRSAVLQQGWPLLDSVRGRVMFVLDAGSETTNEYLKGGSKGRPMFVDVDVDHPSAAFFIMNDPERQQAEIQERVKRGFMVRTRADANTVEARAGDYSRFEAAQTSGAQVISTDYYIKALSPNKDFQIIFEAEKFTRCNPFLRPGECEL